MKCPFAIKVCSKCGEILVAYNGNFSKEKNGKWGLRADCKRCKKKYNKQWREDNPEYDKQYYEEHKEERLEYNKQWREDNPEYDKQWREDNKERIAEYSKQWATDNPDKVFNKHNNRRLREENQGSGITKEQWLEMMNFFEWKCAYSGINLAKDNRNVDHVNPLSKGGLNEIWNCVPMYKLYNISKNANDMEEWYKKQDFYSEERLIKIYEWIEYAYKKWGNIDII